MNFESLYNKKEYSDFQIIDNFGTTIYLHKILLISNSFFKTYFESQFNTNNKMKVDNIEIANIILKYLYTDRFEPKSLELEYHMELLNLANMWLVENFILLELEYIKKKIDNIFDKDFSIYFDFSRLLDTLTNESKYKNTIDSIKEEI